MTSGSVPINALPPEPRPDPQVVAWMRAYRSTLPERLDLVSMRLRTIKAYRGAHTDCSLSLADLGDAYREAARKPLAVADIPAGQGAASLFIAPGDVLGYAVGNAALWIQTEDGPLFIRWAASPGDSPADRALWALIEAHVPTVAATEETP